MDYQNTRLIGTIVKVTDIRYTVAGVPVNGLNLIVHDEVTDPFRETASDYWVWYFVSCAGSLAEFCEQNLRAGHQVLVEGRLAGRPATIPSPGRPIQYMLFGELVLLLGPGSESHIQKYDELLRELRKPVDVIREEPEQYPWRPVQPMREKTQEKLENEGDAAEGQYLSYLESGGDPDAYDSSSVPDWAD